MELQFMTPTEVWEGFNPVRDPLESSIISSEETGNLIVTQIFFTSEITSGGRVRVLGSVAYDKRWRDSRPAVLLIPMLNPVTDTSALVKALVAEGYVVGSFDYCGNTGSDSTRTTYPPEYSYAKFPECQSRLLTLSGSARETPWFQWAKVSRRALSMLADFRLVDPERIAVMGLGHGAQLAWQVAGIDGRVRALVPINGGGYLWRTGKPRFGGNNIPADDAERAFSTGVGAETYAKFVSCPTCYIVSANAAFADVDRAGDILSLVPAESKALMINLGTDSQISSGTFDSLMRWLHGNFAHDSAPLEMPKIDFEQIENELYLRLKTERHARNVKIYVAYGEPLSSARFWQDLGEGQKVGRHEYTFHVPVSHPDEPIVAFASATYPDEITVSSAVVNVIPKDIGVTAENEIPKSWSRVIYTSEMGMGTFSVSTPNIFLDDSVLSLKTGPFGIKGICTDEGNLIMPLNSPEEFSSPRSAIFRFDAFSLQKKMIKVRFVSYPDMKAYICEVVLNGGDFWQKFSLVASDFKSEEGKALPRFGDCKKCVFACAEGVLFNNILWI